MIKIIHQTWKDQNLPVEVAAFQQTWKANHPNWEYRFWTDEDNRQFLQTHYSWFLPIYDSYENKICRVDAVRYFILSYYGGVFIDLDFECLRPLDDLLNGKELVLGLEPSAHVNSPMVQARGLKHIVCPSLMASQPNHPFWQHIWQYLVENHRRLDPLEATGPFLLTRAYDSYQDKNSVTLVDAQLLYPATIFERWEGKLEDSDFRQQITEGAFAIHYWHGTWLRNVD